MEENNANIYDTFSRLVEKTLTDDGDLFNAAMSIPQLTKEDQLFVESNSSSDSFIDTTKSTNPIMVTNGFICTAIILLDTIKSSSNNLVRDSYIFPALFCFRHYLELTMKKSIIKFSLSISNNGDTNQNDNLRTHTLGKLWTELKKYIDYIDDEVDNVDRLIKEFIKYDSDGTQFRYDYELNSLLATKQQKNLKKDQLPLHCLYDIDNLKTRFLQLYRFFEGIEDLAYIAYDNSNQES